MQVTFKSVSSAPDHVCCLLLWEGYDEFLKETKANKDDKVKGPSLQFPVLSVVLYDLVNSGVAEARESDDSEGDFW